MDQTVLKNVSATIGVNVIPKLDSASVLKGSLGTGLLLSCWFFCLVVFFVLGGGSYMKITKKIKKTFKISVEKKEKSPANT